MDFNYRKNHFYVVFAVILGTSNSIFRSDESTPNPKHRQIVPLSFPEESEFRSSEEGLGVERFSNKIGDDSSFNRGFINNDAWVWGSSSIQSSDRRQGGKLRESHSSLKEDSAVKCPMPNGLFPYSQ
ncbi:unnamed protein product, partial [Meganyctiphanes norvegica]